MFVCAVVQGITVHDCSRAQARRGSGRPFWLDARTRARFIAERIKWSQQLTRGVLRLLGCHSYISAVKTSCIQHATVPALQDPSWDCAVIKSFYSLTWPQRIRDGVLYELHVMVGWKMKRRFQRNRGWVTLHQCTWIMHFKPRESPHQKHPFKSLKKCLGLSRIVAC